MLQETTVAKRLQMDPISRVASTCTAATGWTFSKESWHLVLSAQVQSETGLHVPLAAGASSKTGSLENNVARELLLPEQGVALLKPPKPAGYV